MSREESGYRKGVLLGLTIAEIILLLLFALLLALWGQISTMEQDVKRANVINSRFSAVIKSNNTLTEKELASEIEKIISAEILYAQELAKEVEKHKNNLLPDDVFEMIKSQNFDLRKADDRIKFFNLVKMASLVDKESKLPTEELSEQCSVGKDVMEKTKGAGLGRLISDRDHWKEVATSCGKGTSLPSCYQLNGKDVAIYEARLNDHGIYLIDSVPGDLRLTFEKDFPNSPTTEKTLSDSEFVAQTLVFNRYGRENDCRFRVNAYDDTGVDKKYFQRIEKVLDRSFKKSKHW